MLVSLCSARFKYELSNTQQKESVLIFRQLVGSPLASCRDVSSSGWVSSMRHKESTLNIYPAWFFLQMQASHEDEYSYPPCPFLCLRY